MNKNRKRFEKVEPQTAWGAKCTPMEKLVLGAIAYSHENGTDPSGEDLAKLTGLYYKTALRLRRSLADKGLLKEIAVVRPAVPSMSLREMLYKSPTAVK